MLRCDFLAVLIIPFYFKLIFLHEKDLYSCKAFYGFRLICIIISFYFENGRCTRKDRESWNDRGLPSLHHGCM